MRTHKDLLVWQKSMFLVKRIYQMTQGFPKDEVYGITLQIRRAAVSIPSNIAEGYGRNSDKEITRFLYISLGSASEVETQLIICRDIQYLSAAQFVELDSLTGEIIRMLSSLINRRNNSSC